MLLLAALGRLLLLTARISMLSSYELNSSNKRQQPPQQRKLRLRLRLRHRPNRPKVPSKALSINDTRAVAQHLPLLIPNNVER